MNRYVSTRMEDAESKYEDSRNYLPEAIVKKIINPIDQYIQTPTDALVVAVISILSSLCEATYSIFCDDAIRDVPIIYSGALMPAALGKSSAVRIPRKHMLGFRTRGQEEEKVKREARIKSIEKELEKIDNIFKGQELAKELNSLSRYIEPDIMLDDATL